MKNSLSKTLLCGIMASSFLLANCQKAPSRGVKAGVGPAAGKVDGAPLVVVECSDEFLKLNKEQKSKLAEVRKALEDIKDKDATSIDAATKTLLKKLATELKAITDKTIAALEKIKADADRCNDSKALTDKNEPSKSRVKSDIVKEVSDLGVQMKEKTGEDNALSIQAEEAKKSAAETSLEAQMELQVSKDLGDVLDESQKNDYIHLVGGQISAGLNNFKNAQADKSKTVCYATVVAGKLVEKSKIKILTISALTDDKTTKRKKLKVGIISGDVAYELECLIADKAKDARKEFRKAFGAHLTLADAVPKATPAATSAATPTALNLDDGRGGPGEGDSSKKTQAPATLAQGAAANTTAAAARAAAKPAEAASTVVPQQAPKVAVETIPATSKEIGKKIDEAQAATTEKKAERKVEEKTFVTQAADTVKKIGSNMLAPYRLAYSFVADKISSLFGDSAEKKETDKSKVEEKKTTDASDEKYTDAMGVTYN